MVTCPNCRHEFRPTKSKWTREQVEKSRYAQAWKHTEEILHRYKNGDAIMWLARDYKTDKRIIRKILNEMGIKEFRGRKGIQAWNKGLPNPKIQGEKSPHWKGGVTQLNIAVRRCAQYRSWVKQIFNRDDFTCQMCKKRGGYIEADHFPLSFSEIMTKYKLDSFEKAKQCKILWDIRNGRTLCLSCHRTTFKYSKGLK